MEVFGVLADHFAFAEVRRRGCVHVHHMLDSRTAGALHPLNYFQVPF